MAKKKECKEGEIALTFWFATLSKTYATDARMVKYRKTKPFDC